MKPADYLKPCVAHGSSVISYRVKARAVPHNRSPYEPPSGMRPATAEQTIPFVLRAGTKPAIPLTTD